MVVRMHAPMALRMHVHALMVLIRDGRMRGVPKTQRGAVKRTWWTLGCGGAGFVSTAAIMHGPCAPAAIAVGALAAVAFAVAELSSALPAIIAAMSAKKVALEAAQRRTTLVNAGLDGKLDAAVRLLKLDVLDAQVLAGRRLSEEMLRELLPDPRPPYEEDSGLAAIQPHMPGTAARRLGSPGDGAPMVS